MIAKIKDILKEGLKPPLSLSSISYTGRRRMIRIARILQGSPTLPLLIAVEGPPNTSEIADEILEVRFTNMTTWYVAHLVLMYQQKYLVYTQRR